MLYLVIINTDIRWLFKLISGSIGLNSGQRNALFTSLIC